MSQSIRPENINKSFFDGYYKEIWRHIFPEKTTLAEVDWIIQEANLKSGNVILDIMCGYGRHSLEFARRGIKSTAVDTLCDYINEINDKAHIEKLEIKTLCEDVLDMQLEGQYDAAICMGNSIQFFDEEDTIRLLKNTSIHLKQGAKLFINSCSISEIAAKFFKENSWAKIADMYYLIENKFSFNPSRIETNTVIITESGQREQIIGVDYVYSLNEMEHMLDKAGFKLHELYSIPGKKKFTIGEPRIYIVAEKISKM